MKKLIRALLTMFRRPKTTIELPEAGWLFNRESTLDIRQMVMQSGNVRLKAIFDIEVGEYRRFESSYKWSYNTNLNKFFTEFVDSLINIDCQLGDWKIIKILDCFHGNRIRGCYLNSDMNDRSYFLSNSISELSAEKITELSETLKFNDIVTPSNEYNIGKLIDRVTAETMSGLFRSINIRLVDSTIPGDHNIGDEYSTYVHEDIYLTMILHHNGFTLGEVTND